MKADIVWPDPVWEQLVQLPERTMWGILRKTRLLENNPRMYPVKQKGRFRRHRYFSEGEWLVFYRVLEEKVYIRAIWPARMP